MRTTVVELTLANFWFSWQSKILNCGGCFNISQFRQSGSNSDDNGDELRDAFNVMDTDGDGCISYEDLETVLKRIGGNIGKDELEEMIKVADKNGKGSVNIDEFLSIMKS